MTVVQFPKRRRERIEVECCRDPETGSPIWIFEVVTGDGRRLGVAQRNTIEDAVGDVSWWRSGGVQVVELSEMGGSA